MMQVSRGAFEGILTRGELPGAVVYHNILNQTTLATAVSGANHVWRLHPLKWKGEATYNGQTVLPGDVAFYGPGGVHTTRGTDKEVLGVAFDRAVLEHALMSLTQADPPPMQGLSAVLRVPGLLSIESRAIMDELVRSMQTDPGSFDHPDAAVALTQTLQTILLRVLESSLPTRPMRSARTAVTQSKVLRRAAEYLEANAGTNVYVADLCAATGVSIRSLEKIFRAHLGMPAMRYLKLQRLHHAYKLLRDPDSGIASVKAASLSCGFWELGRFAGEYRELFGELPSATLAKRTSLQAKPQFAADSLIRALAR